MTERYLTSDDVHAVADVLEGLADTRRETQGDVHIEAVHIEHDGGMTLLDIEFQFGPTAQGCPPAIVLEHLPPGIWVGDYEVTIDGETTYADVSFMVEKSR